MHARVSTVRFQPGGEDEALHIFRDIMLPSASKQKGFKGALILKSDADPEQHIIISLWKNEEAMLESRPPEEIVPHLEPLEELIAENKQGTYEVLLHIE
jgi:heme-degrading monooxygenase HmoA